MLQFFSGTGEKNTFLYDNMFLVQLSTEVFYFYIKWYN